MHYKCFTLRDLRSAIAYFAHMGRAMRKRADCVSPDELKLTANRIIRECINGEQMPRWDLAHVHLDSVHLRMLEDTVLLGRPT